MSHGVKSVSLGPTLFDPPLTQKNDLPVLLTSRSSSDGTDMGLTQGSRSTRAISIESDDESLHATGENRGSQRSLLFESRESFSNQDLTDYVAVQSTATPRPRRLPSDEVATYGGSDGISLSEKSSSPKQQRGRNHDALSTKSQRRHSTTPISYHGITIATAASQGNLPLCVLLWGMAAAKRVRLMDPDFAGDTPMHFAALADLPEVNAVHFVILLFSNLAFYATPSMSIMSSLLIFLLICLSFWTKVMSFFQQQCRMKNAPQHRHLETKNKNGETPLLRASSMGKIPTLKVAANFSINSSIVVFI